MDLLTMRRARHVGVAIALLAPTLVLAGGDRFVPPASAAPVIGIASSVEQVRPTAGAAGRPTSASLVAARNEFESFQIVVQGPAGNVSVVGDPFGWGTTTLYRVDYYNALEASDAEGGTGLWADILVPERDVVYGEDRLAFPFDVPAGQNRLVWVDLFVPPGTTPGTRNGSLTVNSTGGLVNIPIALKVLGIDLPSTASMKNAYFMPSDRGKNHVCLAHTGLDHCNNAAEQRLLNSLYSRVALENRVSLSNGFALTDGQGPGAHPVAEWETDFEAPLIRGTSTFPSGAGYRLAGAKLTVVSSYAYVNRPQEGWIHCLQACADQWEAEANEPGQVFADRVMWYGCDEAPNQAAWQSCADTLTLTNAGWSRPAFATGTIDHYNTGAVPTGIPISTLVTLINRMHPNGGLSNRPAYDAFLSQPGRGLWLYSSCESQGCADDVTGAGLHGQPGYAIDAPANQHRAMSWMVERYQASGELYWAANQQLGGDPATGGLMNFGVNGDGTLFYPGKIAVIGGTKDIPLESVRLKRIRDGREDYEYMKWLDANGGAAEVDAVVNALYPMASSATVAKDGTGPGSLLAARGQLADLICARAACGSPPTGPGRIAFSRNRDGDFDIFTMNPDGSQVVQVTNDPAADQFPAWSPDGTRIAWTRGLDVWVMNADGSSPVNLTADVGGAASKPAWSPNGSTIAYVYPGCCSATDVYTMASDGSAKTPLVTYSTGGSSAYDPSFSPTGVVFFTLKGGAFSGIHRIGGPPPGAFAQVTTGVDEVVDVSGDGTRITFSRTVSGAPYDVLLANLDGSGIVNLTVAAAGGAALSDFQSTFSPAGDRVAFVSEVGGDREIWTIGTNGAGAVAITLNTATDADPDWGAAAAPPLQTGRYQPLTPARILDTRDGTGGIAGAVGPGATVDVQITGRGGIPATGVAAVAMNVTVTQPSGDGFLTLWPAGTARPLAANLNFTPAKTVPNLAVVKLGTGGKVSMFNSAGTTHVIYDVAGWYSESSAGNDGRYTSLVPARILDTRDGTGGPGAVRLGPGASLELQVAGRGGVPATGAQAAVLNVAVTSTTATSYLTVYPTGAPRPLAANLNYLGGDTVSNRVMAKLGTGGRVTIYNNAGAADVVVDVGGWYSDASVAGAGGLFSALEPARILDTRDATGGVAGPLAGGTGVDVQVSGRGGVPATGVKAVILNATVTQPAGAGYLTVSPTGTPRPLASDLNYAPGETRPNLVVVQVGTGGKVNLFTSTGTHVVFDVAGWIS